MPNANASIIPTTQAARAGAAGPRTRALLPATRAGHALSDRGAKPAAGAELCPGAGSCGTARVSEQ